MKDIINRIQFSRLRNEEHFGFHSEVVKLVNERQISEAFLALAGIYNTRYDVLDGVMEIIRRSVITGELIAADGLRTATYRSLRASVRGHLNHGEAAKRPAAVRLNNIIQHYGNLARTSRDEKTYALTNLLEDLRGKDGTDLQSLDLMGWVSQLEAQNLAYKKLKESRYDEWQSRPAKPVSECRREIDAAYHGLVKQLEVHGMLNLAEENFSVLVGALNERVDAYNRLGVQRRGGRNGQAAVSSSSASSSSLAEAGTAGK